MTNLEQGSLALPRRPIGWRFNVALLFYIVCVSGFEVFALEPEEMPRAPIDTYLETAPVATVAALVAFAIAAIFSVVAITRSFWNRFLTDVFRVRRITVAEALAIVLIVEALIGLP